MNIIHGDETLVNQLKAITHASRKGIKKKEEEALNRRVKKEEAEKQLAKAKAHSIMLQVEGRCMKEADAGLKP